MWNDCLTQEVEEDAAEHTVDNLSTGQVEFCEQVEQDVEGFHDEEPTVDDQVLIWLWFY